MAEELASGSAVRRALEDGRELSLQFPRVEEEGPVDVLAELSDRWLDHLRARERRLGQVLESKAQSLGARFIERQQCSPRRGVLLTQLLLQRAVVAVKCPAPAVVEQIGDHADHA